MPRICLCFLFLLKSSDCGSKKSVKAFYSHSFHSLYILVFVLPVSSRRRMAGCRAALPVVACLSTGRVGRSSGKLAPGPERLRRLKSFSLVQKKPRCRHWTSGAGNDWIQAIRSIRRGGQRQRVRPATTRRGTKAWWVVGEDKTQRSAILLVNVLRLKQIQWLLVKRKCSPIITKLGKKVKFGMIHCFSRWPHARHCLLPRLIKQHF